MAMLAPTSEVRKPEPIRVNVCYWPYAPRIPFGDDHVWLRDIPTTSEYCPDVCFWTTPAPG